MIARISVRGRHGQGRHGQVPRLRAVALVAVVAVAASVLGGCGGPALSSGEQGFVTGDGRVTVLSEDERRPPAGEVSGRTVDGEQIDLADHRGSVVVIPVWGSWCAPCRAEAPMLSAAARDLAENDVVFLGINSRDPNEASVRRFQERFDMSYPSIFDPDGDTLLAFHGVLPPMTIPSFVFIDAEGRVAARALDSVDRSTLYGVVEEVRGRPLDTETAEGGQAWTSPSGSSTR